MGRISHLVKPFLCVSLVSALAVAANGCGKKDKKDAKTESASEQQDSSLTGNKKKLNDKLSAKFVAN